MIQCRCRIFLLRRKKILDGPIHLAQSTISATSSCQIVQILEVGFYSFMIEEKHSFLAMFWGHFAITKFI